MMPCRDEIAAINVHVWQASVKRLSSAMLGHSPAHVHACAQVAKVQVLDDDVSRYCRLVTQYCT